MCKENTCAGVSLQSNHFFFALLSNRAYESEAFDLTKLYFETLFEILVPSQLELYTLHSN